jgi:hypothetical protein
MNLIFTLLFFPTLLMAAKIPVENFDQAKLETLVRSIPSALVRIENQEGFTRKHYLFPNSKKALFAIKCQADYYGEATIPSFKSCDLNIPDKELAADEYLFKITDSPNITSLRNSISYGDEIKSFYSFERVFGQAYDGVKRNLFRFTFICKRDACDVTIATKNPDP